MKDTLHKFQEYYTELDSFITKAKEDKAFYLYTLALYYQGMVRDIIEYDRESLGYFTEKELEYLNLLPEFINDLQEDLSRVDKEMIKRNKVVYKIMTKFEKQITKTAKNYDLKEVNPELVIQGATLGEVAIKFKFRDIYYLD